MLAVGSVELVNILRDRGVCTPEQAEQALGRIRAQTGRNQKSLTAILVESGVSEPALMASLSEAFDLEFVELADFIVDSAAVTMLPESMCRRMSALPIQLEGDQLTVAMSDPTDVVARDDIRSATRHEVNVVLATQSDIDTAITRFHRGEESFDFLTYELDEELDTEGIEDISGDAALVDEAPVVKFVNLIITQALNERASDIHIEPHEHDVRVRFRIDGVLHEVMRSPKALHAAVISRLKIMSDLDISERRLPQGGRVSVKMGKTTTDLRLETLPTVFGEKLIMRILDQSIGLMGLEDLGFSDQNLSRYLEATRAAHGTIILSGPTGSGKSTTLYATLNLLNEVSRNIVTVEDPVEQRLAGLTQIQVHVKAGMTFASALRSILRSDPDVIMVGEMRDRETAKIGVEAAITGHLVLSTIHTNDAPSVLTRLIDMGVEPFLVASSVDCIVGQRLARRICSKCRELYYPPVDLFAKVGWDIADWNELPGLYRPVGCLACSRTGYRGRIAVHEVMNVTEDIERLAVSRVSAGEIRRTAIEQGMVSMRVDGFNKAAAGITSLDEILRVTT